VASESGLEVTVRTAVAELADTEIGTLVVVGGNGVIAARDDQALVAWVRAAAARSGRIASVCSGTFVLAAAGLLDGRRATTHWMRTELLATTYPKIEVVGDVLFVDEGQILTSAGQAAGIDLCLHLIRRDHGVRASTEVARTIVAAPYRSGGQSQVIARSLPAALGDVFAATREWALHRLDEPIGVPEMARHAGVSTRTFGRRFVEDTGYTPMQWILRARIDLARQVLETTDLGVGTGSSPTRPAPPTPSPRSRRSSTTWPASRPAR